MVDVILKRFEAPDEVRQMIKGRFQLVRPAEPHDSWVVGDEPYVSLHFLGADHYAK
jgi:hypothetical protein